jgi:hypothetical protein
MRHTRVLSPQPQEAEAMPTVDPRTIVTFASSVPHTRLWLEIEAVVGAEPVELFAALAAAGWTEPNPPAWSIYAYDEETGQRLDYQVIEHVLYPAGDLPRRASAEDGKKAVAAARAAMRPFGFTRVPHWRKTWQDML